jgi:hypothetical protein
LEETQIIVEDSIETISDNSSDYIVTEIVSELPETELIETSVSTEYIDYTDSLSIINDNIICGNICLFVLCCIAIIVIIYKWIQSLF